MVINIIIKTFDVLGDIAVGTLSVQNHGSCFIRKLQVQILQTMLFKGINIIAFSKKIKDTNKYDIGWRQQVIILALLQQVDIHQRLIIACTLGQHIIFDIIDLHFQVIMRVLVIRHDDIQTNATTCIVRLKRFFSLEVADVSNFNLQ